MKERYMFIDFEFTTFDKKEAPKGFFHEVIEVGMVIIEENEIVDTFSSLVVPVFFPQLGEKCIKLTGITQQDVMEGIEFKAMIDELLAQYIREKTTLVTWGDLDMKGLRRNCREHNIKFPFSVMLEDWLDLSKAYQFYYGHKDTPGLWYALDKYGLAETAQSHRALDDAMATFKVMQMMQKDQWVYTREKTKMQTSIADLMGSQMTLLEKLKQQLS
ncbi:3'-5' exonuclease KapD [Aneurinibacillus thermoaerophilus]|uniref:3'-5' exonuclease KapD n=1 Tax=Aneurinibacillus thermoaerophilus TaxID=143495 RepID=UPI002E1ADE55|nr:3'-5' exonuclease KapD [Aneurinibacillus thermoaerophilus]MED0678528.1 3'-5' exonuclease KapD [Aneurinibacillus thermoaerophilus]MED0765420.1 3'-5' exonuclease KapD [Aneurinibacillus thermoaerophilus]